MTYAGDSAAVERPFILSMPDTVRIFGLTIPGKDIQGWVLPVLLFVLAAILIPVAIAVVKAVRRRRGSKLRPLLPAGEFFAGPEKKHFFENPWVQVRTEKHADKEVARDVVVELEQKLNGKADIIALCGLGGSGKSRVLLQLSKRRKKLRFVNTPGYSSDPAKLAEVLEPQLKKGQVIVLDDLQLYLPLAKQVLDVLFRTKARLLVGCRYPGPLDEVVNDRRFTSEVVLLGEMENVAEVVKATGEKKKWIEDVSKGNPMIAVLADRHKGDRAKITSGADLFAGIVNEVAARFPDPDKGKRVLAEIALRRGVAEGDEPVKVNHGAVVKVMNMGYVETHRSQKTTYYLVKPDIVAEYLVLQAFFPGHTIGPGFAEVVRGMPVTDAFDVLAMLINLYTGYKEARAPEAARKLFALLLKRKEVRESLEKSELGFESGEAETAPAVGVHTGMLIAMVIAAFDGFQLVEPVADMLDRVWKPALELGDPNLLNELGARLQKTGKVESALLCYERAEKLAGKAGDKRLQAMALGNIGNVYVLRGELDKALEYHTQAVKVFEDIGARQEQANVLGNIGLIWRDKGELDKALECQEQALAIGREIGDKAGVAKRLGNIGLIWQDRGELDKALEKFEAILEIHRELGDRAGEAKDLGNIGLIWQDKGELDKALEHQEQALEIDREIGNRQGEAQDLGNIGNVYMLKGELDKALECQEQALRMRREIGNRLEEAQALGNIGLIWQDKGELDKALEYLQKALDIQVDIGDKLGQARQLGNIGNDYILKGELDKALEYQEKSAEICRELGDREGAATALLNMGSIFIDKKDWEQAIVCYVPALMEHLAMGIADGPRQCLFGLRKCYRAMKGSGEGAGARFIAVCVKAGMSEADAKKLVVKFEQGKEQQLEQEEEEQLEPEVLDRLVRMHGELGHEKFVAKCIEDGMEKDLATVLAVSFEETEKEREEFYERFKELGSERFVADCIERGISEGDAKMLAESFEEEKEMDRSAELVHLYADLGPEKFVEKCVEDGMEKRKAEMMATVLRENEKQSREFRERFKELGTERFAADCVERGMSEEQAKELVEMFEQAEAQETKQSDTSGE